MHLLDEMQLAVMYSAWLELQYWRATCGPTDTNEYREWRVEQGQSGRNFVEEFNTFLAETRIE
jgi:hypothetical protein